MNQNSYCMEHNDTLFSLHIDPQTKPHLAEAAKWARFLSIVGMVALVLMMLFSFYFSSMITSQVNPYSDDTPGAAGIFSGLGAGFLVMYLIIAIIWLFPLLYLYRFATRMGVALHSNDQQALNSSFQNLKICFRYVGIVTIIILVIYLLFFVLALLTMGMA